MRHTLFLLLLMLSPVARAQDAAPDTMNIDAAFEACVAMQESLEQGDTAALVRAAARLKEAGAVPFADLHCKDDTLSSLDGHFVFSKVFVDSLSAGRDAYAHADRISKASAHRGQTPDGSILTKTCFVRAGAATRYSFAASGWQELGIIAEPGGRVYVRIHVRNPEGLDARYNDDRNAARGARRYRTAFKLPENRRNTVELEVINRGTEDTSFVVISN